MAAAATLPTNLPPSLQILSQRVERIRVAGHAGRSVAPAPDVVTWAEQTATIVHPQHGRVPFVPYPYQRAFLACAAPRRIILKARQVGFSQVFALEALHTAITRPESTILLISRSQDLAVNLLRACYQTYAHLRDAPPLTKENASEMGLANGSRIKSIPANRSTGRGFAATDVYLDEFAYIAYADDIYQSVSPTISQGGRLTIGSTPHGVGNLFHTLYMGDASFTRFTVPWHDCPAYYTDAERAAGVPPEQAAWYQASRPTYSAQQWASEFDCDFIGSGLALFNATDIDRATDGAWGPTPPQPGHRYLTSVDLGRKRDATVINTFDLSVHPVQRVAFERLTAVPWPLMQQAIEQRVRLYGGRRIIESNGIGDPVIANLNVAVEEWTTSARSKVQAIQALQLLLEQGDLKAQWDARERQALLTAAWDDDHTADEIMSLAIGAVHLLRPYEPGI